MSILLLLEEEPWSLECLAKEREVRDLGCSLWEGDAGRKGFLVGDDLVELMEGFTAEEVCSDRGI